MALRLFECNGYLDDASADSRVLVESYDVVHLHFLSVWGCAASHVLKHVAEQKNPFKWLCVRSSPVRNERQHAWQ